MMSLVSAPSSLVNFEPISRYLTRLPSSSLAISLLIVAIFSRTGVPALGPRGKTPSSSTLVCGELSPSLATMALMPSAICSALLLPVLFVPIIRTASFGLMPSSSPLLMRHRTCSVRSPPMPKLAALSGAKCFSQVGLAAPPRQASVIESPRKSRSTSPFLAMATKPSCRFIQPASGWPPLADARRRGRRRVLLLPRHAAAGRPQHRPDDAECQQPPCNLVTTPHTVSFLLDATPVVRSADS